MDWDQITGRWRVYLVQKLRERWGLTEIEAGKKADAWMEWLEKEPNFQSQILRAKDVQEGARRSPETGFPPSQ
jgi:hypothetical protein